MNIPGVVTKDPSERLVSKFANRCTSPDEKREYVSMYWVDILDAVSKVTPQDHGDELFWIVGSTVKKLSVEDLKILSTIESATFTEIPIAISKDIKHFEMLDRLKCVCLLVTETPNYHAHANLRIVDNAYVPYFPTLEE